MNKKRDIAHINVLYLFIFYIGSIISNYKESIEKYALKFALNLFYQAADADPPHVRPLKSADRVHRINRMQLNKIVAVHDFLNYAVTVVNNYNRIVATVNRGLTLY